MPELMYDQFMIKYKVQLNNDDIDSLTKFYLPIMGMDSYALYFGLSSLDSKKEYTFKELLDTLNFRSVKSIDKASSKLEALGLIKVYQNKDKNYLYELLRPLSAYEFLQEESLKAFLASKISEGGVEKLEKEYLYSYAGYKDITKKFVDVFEVKSTDNYSYIRSLVPNKFELSNENFNYALFKMYFDTTFITDEALDNPELKSNIIKASKTYLLNEEQMKDVVMSAFNIDKTLSYATLAKYAKFEYRNKYESKYPTLVTKEKDDYLESIQDEQVLSLCAWLEGMVPAEVLEYYSKMKPSEAEIAMFDKLANNTKMPLAVINLMIVFSIIEKEGEIPGYQYFEKIANTWARAKVNNVYDAVKYLNKKVAERQEKQENKTSNVKAQVSIPNWYESYKNELKKNASSNSKLQASDALEILEAAKGIFGDDDE